MGKIDSCIVTGPIHSLPGSRHNPTEGAMCYEHPDRPATVLVQGETDSFGSEMYNLCAECAAKEKQPMIATCDWCKGHDLELRPRRDYDEGMCGPVYYVCQACITEDNARIQEEYEADRDYYGDYDED